MSALRKVIIEGLRGFSTRQSLEVAVPNGNPGSGITFLTGPNNSGKSTVIEAFRFYLWRHNRPSFHEGMRNRTTNKVRIEYHYEDRLDYIESIRAGGSETQDNIVPGRVTPYVIPPRRYFAPYFGRQAQIYDRANFLLTSGDHPGQRGPNLNMFEMRLFDIDRNVSKRVEFNRIIEKIIPQGVNWTIDQTENTQFVLRFLGDEKAHSAEGVGEGIASLFTLVAAFYDSLDGDIIVIDEPELSLHPTFQKRLSRVISDFATTRQIIVSTHSPYMIDEEAISNGARLCRTWERATGTEINQLDEKAVESWRSLTGANLNNPHQFGLAAKEVFFLDEGVVVVEGQEDVVFLPRAFSLLGLNIPAEFFGWGAGGASNINFVCSILHSLGYRRVVALFDNDRATDMQTTKDEFPKYLVDCLPAPDVRAKKATTARKAKRGLLKSSNEIDPEYKPEAETLFASVVAYLGAEALVDQTPSVPQEPSKTPSSSVFVQLEPHLIAGYQKPDPKMEE